MPNNFLSETLFIFYYRLISTCNTVSKAICSSRIDALLVVVVKVYEYHSRKNAKRKRIEKQRGHTRSLTKRW